MRSVLLNGRAITIEDLDDLAHQRAEPNLPLSDETARELDAGADYLLSCIEQDESIYGITTGYGEDCRVQVSGPQAFRLPTHLVRYHGCGTGELLAPEQTIAVMVLSYNSIYRGFSGVRSELVRRLGALLQHKILPCIPAEGSVGASGDLTPLSYIAATIMGEREVLYRGSIRPSREALKAIGLEPLVLAPKEALALMNSTAVLTGLAALAHRRARYVARIAAAIAGMIMDVKGSRREHMDQRIFELKPHPGQLRCAGWIREYVQHEDREEPPQRRIQDRYSLRCSAHVIGALMDMLPWARQIIETEMASVNDNPLILHRQRAVLHGCNFYGGHIGLVMDTLKTATASIADLVDRQLMLLLNAGKEYNLPINLNGAANEEQAFNHGFKAMQITASALTAEALRNTMPATSFSRSTESHNQDKVSMGTIAARDAHGILDLTEKVLAIGLLCAAQAVDLRGSQHCSPASRTLRDHIRRDIPMVTEDRRMDVDISLALNWIRQRRLPVRDDG